MEQFLFEFFGRVGSSVLATYLIRFIDKKTNKNDRHSPKHGH